MAGKRVPIQESYIIPSKGLVYGDAIPEKFVLRPMTTMEEKLRLSTGPVMNILPKLIQRCTVEPQEFDASKLKLFDLQYLWYKLRIVTYGPKYDVSVICPHCRHRFTASVNLDDLPVNYIADDFKEPFDLEPLPVSGDVLSCRFMDASDADNLESATRRLLQKVPNYEGDPEMILEWTYKIYNRNGEPMPGQEIQNYIENLHARDFLFLQDKYNEIFDSIGISSQCSDVCPSCGNNVEFSLPVTQEFFRPNYRNIR